MLAVKKAVQTRGKADIASRKHAEALSIEDVKKLMRWSELKCANDNIEEVRTNRENRPVAKDEVSLTIEQLHVLFEHAFMRAFVSSAFTLWTR